jgi:hemoglobin
MAQQSLYERLGGYDGISTFANDLLPRLQGDTQLGRFGRIEEMTV